MPLGNARKRLRYCCGSSDHLVSQCVQWRESITCGSTKGDLSTCTTPAVSTTTYLPLPLFIIPTMLKYSDTCSVFLALIGSRAVGNIDQGIVKQLQIPLMEFTSPMELNTIDRGPMRTGIIMHRTPQHPVPATSIMSKSRSLSWILPSTCSSLETPGFTSTTQAFLGQPGIQ